MNEPTWMTRQWLDTVHALLIERHGGLHGIRDEGALESALARPQMRWAYEPACTLAELAACYGFGLAKNHGYLDGNKRIGFAALTTFLAQNGLMLTAAPAEATETMIAVASGVLNEDGLAAWVAVHTVAR